MALIVLTSVDGAVLAEWTIAQFHAFGSVESVSHSRWTVNILNRVHVFALVLGCGVFILFVWFGWWGYVVFVQPIQNGIKC